ncbi:MAG: SGNH/GDSL hydrolase family protein [Planctomycetes bacterium]|nr:SGNH/GDSL hydrolase family protein [Planctomycetota bacterium]
MSRARLQKAAFAAAVTGTSAALLLGGIVLGERLALQRIRRMNERFGKNEVLGQLLAPGERAGVAACYLDPAAALAALDAISWVPPATPTPFVGHAAAPGRSANATIGPHQFRDARALGEKAPGVYRIFLVGGSTAYGSGAPSDDRTIAGYLEALLAAWPGRERRTFEVITAAYPGWASTHELLWITQHVLRFEPDLVVALSGNNDVFWGFMGEDVRWFHSYPDRHFLDQLDRARAGAGLDPYPAVLPDVREAGVRPPVPPSVVAERLLQNARRVNEVVEDAGARYVFALQPTLACSEKPLTPRERGLLPEARGTPELGEHFRACYAELRRAIADHASAAMPLCDVSDAFDACGADEEVFIDSCHVGDRGNLLIAQRLLSVVVELLGQNH